MCFSKSFIISAFLLGSFTTFAQTTDKNAVLMTIKDTKVTVGEFEAVYHKNANASTVQDNKTLSEYIDLFVNFKLKVKEAEEFGLDTTKNFKDELSGYRRQLAQPYLTDKDVNQKLLEETYKRLQEDINASHILIKVDEAALPKDTAEAYARIMLIRDAVLGNPITPAKISNYENILKGSINLSKKIPADSLRYKGQLESIKSLSKMKFASDAFGNTAKMMVINTDYASYKQGIKEKVISDDPSAKDNGGNLGYFTALQMVYPFENAAYNTKVGTVSMPIRTKYGYHIVKVHDRRKAQGEILVAHIMVKTSPEMTKDDSLNAKTKINEIYTKLQQGGKFEELAQQFSDDKVSGAKGGELPWFGTGRMPVEFEAASFAITNKGDYCAPMQTKYGWHIIKLIDKKPLAPFETMQNELKAKLQRDSRAEAGRVSLIAKVKKENNFKENPQTLKEFYAVVDSSYCNATWTSAKASKLTKAMFNLGNKEYTQTDFAKYLEAHQVKRNQTDVSALVNQLYKQYVEESVVSYEESVLDQKYPEFKALMQEYRDGILLFELTDKKVWSKAVKDTTGAMAYYEKNKTNYMWDERADAVVYSCLDAKVAEQVRKMLKKNKTTKEILMEVNKTSQLNLQVEEKLFTKGENEYVTSNWNPAISQDITSAKDNRIIIVNVRKLMKPEPKAYIDCKGMVTADYQAYLEKEWIAELKKKYPVSIDQSVLSTIK